MKKVRILKKTLVENCVIKRESETTMFKISEPIMHETDRAFGFITRDPREKFWLPKSFATVIRHTNEETNEAWLTVIIPSWFYDRHIEQIARL